MTRYLEELMSCLNFSDLLKIFLFSHDKKKMKIVPKYSRVFYVGSKSLNDKLKTKSSIRKIQPLFLFCFPLRADFVEN